LTFVQELLWQLTTPLASPGTKSGGRGDPARLSVSPDWPVPHSDWLFISAFNSEFEIRSFTLEAVNNSSVFADESKIDPIMGMDGLEHGLVFLPENPARNRTRRAGSGGIRSTKWRSGAIKAACWPAVTPSRSRTSWWDNETQVLCTLSSEGTRQTLFALLRP